MPDNESESEIGHFKLIFKCLSCNLFFAVLTIHRAEWLERLARKGIYCEHCKSNDVTLDSVVKEREVNRDNDR